MNTRIYDEETIYTIKKGLDIRISGAARKTTGQCDLPDLYALKPTDFHGLTPKMSVKEGDNVKIGSVLFFDKNRPEIKFVSPVSGNVKSINRGERRQILEIVVQSDGKDERESFKIPAVSTLDREQTIKILLSTGMWSFIKQRPYNLIANPDDNPKAIFISGFDTSPLAPDIDFILTGNEHYYHEGMSVLLNLCDNIHTGMKFQSPNKVCTSHRPLNFHYFEGPHPAGNVGVQINHVMPLNKGEKIWTISPHDILLIGKLFSTGVLDFSRLIALTGPSVITPMYFNYKLGASISEIIKNIVKGDNNRYISGNILTGTQIAKEGYLGFYDAQITVIDEGDKEEFLGWALPGLGKLSVSRSFFSWMCKNRLYKLNTNMHGGRRAIVVSGEYDKVMPMDILTEYLIKAILAEDIDKMENLGIYEVVEEDIALCEYVCTSKLNLQTILRKGMELMINC
jgi:Na+-transporting NADH:ubiquinone oxidoreductase subunit A